MIRSTFMVLTISLFLTGTLLAFSSKGQNMDKTIISVNLKNARLGQVFDELERKSVFSFTYPTKMADIGPVSLQVKDQSLSVVLERLAKSQRLKFTRINQMISVSRLPPPAVPGKISGMVLDEKGEPLPGASIRVIENGVGTQAGADGNYSLSLQPGSYTLEITYLSFQTQRITGVVVSEDKVTRLDIAMKLDVKGLTEVVITGTYQQASVAGLYARQKNNSAVTDGITAEQISRTPDNNAAQVLNRISGVKDSASPTDRTVWAIAITATGVSWPRVV